jgi:hypothetical protein
LDNSLDYELVRQVSLGPLELKQDNLRSSDASTPFQSEKQGQKEQTGVHSSEASVKPNKMTPNYI